MELEYQPPDTNEVSFQYNLRIPHYTQLLNEMKYCLEKMLIDNNIRYSNIEARLKEYSSFYEKIIRKKLSENFFNIIEDIVGLRIICLYRHDLDIIESLINDNFVVLSSEIFRRKEKLSFGYMSDHYIVNLPNAYSGPRYDEIKHLKCEIQVRTISMHAWSTVSHHLDYKQEIDIPKELRKDFNALSGVFYIADTLFEQFKDARDANIRIMLNDIELNKFNLNMEINLDTLNGYILWKFPNRHGHEEEEYAYLLRELLNEINMANLTTLKEIDDIIVNRWEEFLKKDTPREDGMDYFFSGIGVIRINLQDEFPHVREEILARRTQESEEFIIEEIESEESDNEEI